MVDRQTTMPGIDLGLYHDKNVIITNNITLHPIQHSVGRNFKYKNNISNDNQISEVWDALLWGITSWVFTQRDSLPLPPIRILYRVLPGKGISRNINYHQEMVQKCVLLVHIYSGQQPGLLKNYISWNHMLISKTTHNPILQDILTKGGYQEHHLPPLVTVMKWSTRK